MGVEKGCEVESPGTACLDDSGTLAPPSLLLTVIRLHLCMKEHGLSTHGNLKAP